MMNETQQMMISRIEAMRRTKEQLILSKVEAALPSSLID